MLKLKFFLNFLICCCFNNLFQALNDGVGFITPLLLNKLIRFLQKGLMKEEAMLFFFCLFLASIS